MYVHIFQELVVPKHVMEVIEEELGKLSFLDAHSSEFKWAELLDVLICLSETSH